VRAAVDLAGLKSKDIRVEAVVGRVGPSGALEDTEVIVLPATEEFESVTVFRQRDYPAPHRPSGLRSARQPESL